MASWVFAVDSDGNIVVSGGVLGASSVDIPAGTIVDAHVNASAGISASKLEQARTWIHTQEGTAADRTYATWIKGATGSLKHFTVSCGVVPNGASTVTVDLQVGGVSVLAAVVTLNSSSVADTEYTATISSADLEDGDRLEVVINETTTGTTVQYCEDVSFRVDWDEDYAS